MSKQLDDLLKRPRYLPKPTADEIVAAALRKLHDDLARVGTVPHVHDDGSRRHVLYYVATTNGTERRCSEPRCAINRKDGA